MAKFQKIPLSPKRAKMVNAEAFRLCGWAIAGAAVFVKLLRTAMDYGGVLTGQGTNQILEDMGLKEEVDEFAAGHYNKE